MNSQDNPTLRPDFARRVIKRVRQAKRRRRLYRWALTSTAACALALVAIRALSVHKSMHQPLGLVGDRDDRSSEQVAALFQSGSSVDTDVYSFHQPLFFLFPSAIAVANSSEGGYWHSYDPWWNANRRSD
jgi:hypothetical protein